MICAKYGLNFPHYIQVDKKVVKNFGCYFPANSHTYGMRNVVLSLFSTE